MFNLQTLPIILSDQNHTQNWLQVISASRIHTDEVNIGTRLQMTRNGFKAFTNRCIRTEKHSLISIFYVYVNPAPNHEAICS